MLNKSHFRITSFSLFLIIIAAIFVIPGISLLTITYKINTSGTILTTISRARAVWIQNEGWPAMNPNILTTNLPKVVNDLKNNNINYAFVFVGYWSPPATINYQHPDAYYTNVINALHAAGIKAIAWAEAYNNPMDITAANRNNLYNAIIDCMNRCPWDGYNDDIEPPYIGTLQDQIDFLNGLTPILHGLGKLNMPDVPYDWEQNINQYLYVDFIVSMFYGSTSTLESSQAAAFWQEEFGEYQGYNTPPASPLIIGLMNYYGNQYPLAWQLGEVGKYLSLYGHPNLAGFSIWLYEYMGTTPDDWTQWNYWITRIGTTTPPLYTITVNSSPLSVQMSFNGALHYTPNGMYAFTGSEAVITPSQVQGETHSVLFGGSDHTGGAEGYSSYTYASGPYELDSPASVNSVYIYTPVTGNVKLAIYSSRNYVIPGWIGVNEHPDQLLTQSQPMTCAANSWNLVSIPSVTLPAGYYFIVIKGDTTGIIGVSGLTPKQVEGQAYGYDQWITQSYITAFNQTFPQPEGAMQNDASAYIPTAPIVITPYTFSHWEDGSTSLIRTVIINSNMTITAYYAGVP